MISWEGKGEPNAQNFPASGWFGDDVLLHEGDTYIDTLTGDKYTCSIGKNFSLRIDGKSIQDGTPTPSNPVPVQVVQGANVLSLTPYRVGSSFYNIAVGTQIPEQASDANVNVTELDGLLSIACSTTWRGIVLVSDALNEGFSYALSYGATTTTGTYGRSIYVLNANHEVVRNLGNGTAVETSRTTSVTIATGEKYIAVAFGVRSTAGTVTVDKARICYGDITQPYVPYGALGLQVTGRNLFDVSQNVNGYYIDANGVPHVDSVNAYSGLVPVAQGGYVFSGTDSGTASGTKRIHGYDANGAWVQQLAYNSAQAGSAFAIPFTVPSGIKYVRTSFRKLDTNLQIERGATATEYEPYYSTITPIDLDGNVLASLPDGTKDVLTVDTTGHVTLTKNVGAETFDGTGNYSGGATGTSGWGGSSSIAFYRYPGTIKQGSNADTNVLSNSFKPYETIYGYDSRVDGIALYVTPTSIGSRYISFRIARSALTDYGYDNSSASSNIAAVKAWNADGHTFIVYYPLATPTMVDLGYIDMPDIFEGDTVELIASLSTDWEYTFSWLPVWTLTNAGNVTINWGAPELYTSFRYVVVDRNTWGEVREITDITGGTISRKYLSAVKEGATLDYENTAQLLGIGNDYLRVYLDADDGNVKESIALGTYRVSTPTQTMSDSGVTGQATCYSVLELINYEGLDGVLSIMQGTNLINFASDLLTSRGLNVDIQGESDTVAADEVSFNTDSSILDVVTWCTQAAGFGTPLVDGYGTVLLQPYHDPSYNAPDSLYDSTSTVLFPEYDHELDSFSLPNKVVVVSSTPETVVVGSAVNDDPSNPYSTVARGFVVSAKYDVDNLTTEEQANAKAAQLLRNLSLVESVEIEHLYNGSRLHDVFGIYEMGNYAIVNQDLELSPGCPVKERGRRFV